MSSDASYKPEPRVITYTGTFNVDENLEVFGVELKSTSANNKTAVAVTGDENKTEIVELLSLAINAVAKDVLQYAYDEVKKAAKKYDDEQKAGNERTIKISIANGVLTTLMTIADKYNIQLETTNTATTSTIQTVSDNITTLIHKLESYKKNFNETYKAAQNLKNMIVPCLNRLSKTIDDAERVTNEKSGLFSKSIAFVTSASTASTAMESLQCINSIKKTGETAYNTFLTELQAFTQPQAGGRNRRRKRSHMKRSRIKKTHRRRKSKKRAHTRTH